MRRPPLARRIADRLPVPILLLLLPLAGCELPFAPGADDYPAELLARKGRLVSVTSRETGRTDELVLRDVTLRASTGLVARLRVRTPLGADADPRAVVLLLGGVDRGGDAIDLIPPGLPQVGAALWYPDALDADDAADALRRLETLTELVLDIPASLLLALDYLAALPETDAARIAVVGASFGGFFVPSAAVADERIANVGLLYTGGDLAALLAAHLEAEVPPAAAVLGGELATLRLQRLEPVRYVGAISPRPVLLVNGLRDDLVVRESAEALIRATRQPKDVVWLDTGHLDPDDEPLLRELVDTALARLPVLRAP